MAVGVAYGGQGDKHDFHNCGYSFSTIRFLLWTWVSNELVVLTENHSPLFLFRDGTLPAISGIPVSLNVEAEK